MPVRKRLTHSYQLFSTDSSWTCNDGGTDTSRGWRLLGGSADGSGRLRLSTMLTPMVLLLMGPHEAVAVVAIVHGAHNAGKFAALKEHVDFHAFRKYGVWLVVGAILWGTTAK